MREISIEKTGIRWTTQQPTDPQYRYLFYGGEICVVQYVDEGWMPEDSYPYQYDFKLYIPHGNKFRVWCPHKWNSDGDYTEDTQVRVMRWYTHFAIATLPQVPEQKPKLKPKGKTKKRKNDNWLEGWQKVIRKC